VIARLGIFGCPKVGKSGCPLTPAASRPPETAAGLPFALTSVSAATATPSTIVVMPDSQLALYTKLQGGRCLNYVGREGMRSCLARVTTLRVVCN